MIELSLQQAAEVLGVTVTQGGARVFRGVGTDSRNSCDGQMFVALSGENFDGHEFVAAALAQGAVAALVERELDVDIPQLVVSDSKLAMAQLATYWRHQCSPTMVALTGSNGKTTVKEMLHQILMTEAPTLATAGNFNNDIGVPLTLFRLSSEHRYAVIEMGANHAGEIANLAAIAEPDIVYVNNVAAAHLEGFGSLDGVMRAKGEIYGYCKPQHQALFNADEVKRIDYWRSICNAVRTTTCALDQEADLKAEWKPLDSGLQLSVHYQGQTASCELAVLGEHNARNAIAAISLAVLAGVDFPKAVQNLVGFGGVKGRLQTKTGPAGSRIIDDSYNANPDSLEAGIRVLCDLSGTAWLALGDMGELGDDAEAMHVNAARLARELGVQKFFGVGEMSRLAAREFGEQGYGFEDIDVMAEQISQQIAADHNLLVKGSRSAGMDRLVSRLLDSAAQGGSHAG